MNKNSKKPPNINAIIIIVAVILISMLSESLPYYMVTPMIVGIIFMAVVAIVLVNAAKKMMYASQSGAQKSAQSYAKPAVKSAPKHEEAKHYDFSVERSQGKYSAYDHDTAHRLEQLDSFLKNGIIDKKEYKLLKERYMRGE